MKHIGLLLFLLLLGWMQQSRAQTASSRPLAGFYSPAVQQRVDAARHPAPVQAQDALPSKKEVPQKVKDLGRDAHVPTGQPAKEKLPGNSNVDAQALKDRNKRFIP